MKCNKLSSWIEFEAPIPFPMTISFMLSVTCPRIMNREEPNLSSFWVHFGAITVEYLFLIHVTSYRKVVDHLCEWGMDLEKTKSYFGLVKSQNEKCVYYTHGHQFPFDMRRVPAANGLDCNIVNDFKFQLHYKVYFQVNPLGIDMNAFILTPQCLQLWVK